MRSRFDLIRKPYITEKSVLLKEQGNKVVFRVAKDANKVELKSAIESIFKVTVVKIATINVKGKKKRQGRWEGRRPGWKKAIVTLKKDDKIEYFEGA